MINAIAIIVAAGEGARAGDGGPKQFRQLLGRRVVDWSIAAFAAHPHISHTILVLPPLYNEAPSFSGPNLSVVSGGATRTQSVAAALAQIDAPPETPVLIHDAARPGLSQTMITRIIEALDLADAVAPALIITDALKDTSADRLATVPRDNLKRIQTPQAFRLAHIRGALIGKNEALNEAPQPSFVDDLEAIEAAGLRVHLVAGEARLGKLTYPEDFDMIGKLMSPIQKGPRMGTGFDVHRFGAGDHVTLCGVRIPHTHGLIGHSDADIGWHALTDAILGALAMGDIGDHFPPSDPQWKDADSGTFLAHAANLAQTAGYAISHVDITLICEAPKIKPHRHPMRHRTADLLGIDLSMVSVKATTTEGLGFTGRREGIAGQAAAVLTPLPDLC
ncbi:MAG: bifunctional 2-C-methyl-D-erythritol 4-phosphate cytidylyltransferase/2-C-methyl-D-erythritol 2,4-cyclodiphosphate synthase [Pseudomonadota bacterium]